MFRYSGGPTRRLLLAGIAGISAIAVLPFGTLANEMSGPARVVAALGDDLGALARDAGTMSNNDRLDAVAGLLDRYFDLPRIAANTIGVRRFRDLNDTQRDTFVDTYTRFTIASYVRRLPRFDESSFVVGTVKDGPSGLSSVRATYEGGDEARSVLDFVVSETPDGFRIVDLRIDGDISELAVRRAEVSKVLDDKGFDGLIALLRERTTSLTEG